MPKPVTAAENDTRRRVHRAASAHADAADPHAHTIGLCRPMRSESLPVKNCEPPTRNVHATTQPMPARLRRVDRGKPGRNPDQRIHEFLDQTAWLKPPCACRATHEREHLPGGRLPEIFCGKRGTVRALAAAWRAPSACAQASVSFTHSAVSTSAVTSPWHRTRTIHARP